jgi:outer membrane protein OmpA-like peptidoglycan-associated protein
MAGNRESNYLLGLRRAEEISKYIQQEAKVDGGNIFTDSHGQDDPVKGTEGKVHAQENRRVEVIVR